MDITTGTMENTEYMTGQIYILASNTSLIQIKLTSIHEKKQLNDFSHLLLTFWAWRNNSRICHFLDKMDSCRFYNKSPGSDLSPGKVCTSTC